MSLLAPKAPPPCKCGTKLFPKMAEVYEPDPNRLKPWESFPTVSFGADAGAVDSSGIKNPGLFFATLLAGVAIGYIASTIKSAV